MFDIISAIIATGASIIICNVILFGIALYYHQKKIDALISKILLPTERNYAPKKVIKKKIKAYIPHRDEGRVLDGKADAPNFE
jgi:hypothetical protein